MSRQEEHHAQAALVRWLAARGVTAMAIPNGARRNPRQAAWLKAEGMIAGAPDLVLAQMALINGVRRPVAIEMKRANGGRVSVSQERVHYCLVTCGWIVLVCYGLDDAIRQVSHVYGWPVPQSSLQPSPPRAAKTARATGRRTASGATSTPATSPPSSPRTHTRVRRVDLP